MCHAILGIHVIDVVAVVVVVRGIPVYHVPLLLLTARVAILHAFFCARHYVRSTFLKVSYSPPAFRLSAAKPPRTPAERSDPGGGARHYVEKNY